MFYLTVNASAYTIEFFTITAEIHARSLAKLYGQYADRHMNLKFVLCVMISEREWENRQSVAVKNKHCQKTLSK